MFDIVIKNGLLVDGTGRKPYIASLGIKEGKIIAIDENLNDGIKVIDITGLAIAPGFIDIHSHSDVCPLIDERSESKTYQGVTTELVGNCGMSFYPSHQDKADDVKKYVMNQFQLNNKKKDWVTYSIGDFEKILNKKKKAINWASLIGHGTLRTCVMGFDDRKPTEAEMELMKKKLADELSAGAFGMSLGLTYPTGSFSEIEELIELAKVIAENDAIMAAHIRGESDTIFVALEEMIEIARKSGAHVHISHIKLMGKAQWGKTNELLEVINKAQEEGLKISCDQYPYVASSTGLSVLVPKWAHEGGTPKMVERLNGIERDQVLKEIMIEMNKRGGAERVVITSTYGRFPQVEGKTIASISKELNISEKEVVARILTETEGSTSAIYYSMSEDDVKRIMKEKNIAIGSDGYAFSYDGSMITGKPHPRSFGTFPRFIKMVRENKLMTLEDAIFKITALPAKLIGLKDRGIIKENYIADLVVFNPDKIADTATFENPFSKPIGIHHVFVSGKTVILDGKQTEVCPGKTILST